jgi:alkanesulfonate monooxygenase SsuD/methylene tetrahydromethanopterin reductase-like flavin-dependent oxidoreductase (luciferase family)
LHSGEYFGFEGKYYSIPASKMCPVPTQQTPILLGGHAEPALKRAARIADGWIHAGGDIESLKPMIKRLNELRDEYGTADKPFQIHAMTADAYSVEGVQQLEELGVSECIIGGRDAYSGKQDNSSVEDKRMMMQWFSDNIINKVNA